jgi:hypothetical protein
VAGVILIAWSRGVVQVEVCGAADERAGAGDLADREVVPRQVQRSVGLLRW